VIASGAAGETDVPTWVGVLDLDRDGPVVGVSGALLSVHVLARVLARVHRAPLGFVTVATQPVETLAARARTTATATLADALANHVMHDVCGGPESEIADWSEGTTCPSRFPATGGEGVTVAIPTRNRAALLRDCLLTIMQTTYEPLEILVVDNAPSDQSTQELVAELARADARITYACEPQPGASAARNLALGKARYELVALTDDDVLVDPGWVSAMVAAFASDPGVTCVTGLVAASALDNPFQRYFEGRYPNQSMLIPLRYDLDHHRQSSPLYPFAAGLFGRSANMAVRRGSAQRIGGFDTLLGVGAACRGGEDLDFFVRLLLDGGRICFMPSAVVWHRHRENADALRQAIYGYGYGLGAYLSKHLGNPDLRHALISHAVRQGGLQASRMKAASRSSRFGVAGSRLVVSEAFGLLAGAVAYRIARRRLASASPGFR
jgi:glycosyltransferase involved in cell wall biosynthesis